MKVFSVHKWKESMGFDRKGAEDDLANGWPQEWDGKTEKQITKLGYNTIYEWMVDKKDWRKYEGFVLTEDDNQMRTTNISKEIDQIRTAKNMLNTTSVKQLEHAAEIESSLINLEAMLGRNEPTEDEK